MVPPNMSTTMRATNGSPLPPASPGRNLCGYDHEHFSMGAVDEVFNINVDDMFVMLFTNSPLFQEFIRRRRTYDVKLSEWPELPDEKGEKKRTIYYTLSINYAIGPKCSPSTEHQLLFAESTPGQHYLIDADCMNGGVPYSDHFSTVIRYCMTRVGPSQTRLCITGRVVYHKTVWGVIKSFIEKTAVSGCAESFGVMADLLRAESTRNTPVRPPRHSTANRPSTLPLLRSNSTVPTGTDRIVRYRTLPVGSSRPKDKVGRQKRRRDSDVGSQETSTSEINYRGRRGTLESQDIMKEDISYWETFSQDPTNVLLLLLFIVIVSLVIVNVSLYYSVSVLETTVAKTMLRAHRMR